MLRECQGQYILIRIWVREHWLRLEIKLESINSITRTSTHFTGLGKGRPTTKECGTQKPCKLTVRFHRNRIPLKMNQSLKVRKKRTSPFLMSTSTRCWMWWCLITPSHSPTTRLSPIKTNIARAVRMLSNQTHFRPRRIHKGVNCRSMTATSYLLCQHPTLRKLIELPHPIKARRT